MALRLGRPDRRQRQRGEPFGEPRRHELITRLRGMFREMPGLRLTIEEAGILAGVTEPTAAAVLEAMAAAGLLRRSGDGRYLQDHGDLNR